MSSTIEIFEKWFKGLAETEKKDLVEYIVKNYTKQYFADSYYSGPSPSTKRSYFSGPAPTSSNVCPTCNRPY